MATFCPQCSRQFDDSGGFCPFDGTRLATRGEPLPRFDGEVISLKDVASTTMALKRLEAAAGPDPYEMLVGTTLDGRYRIERVLGEGGMGVVFLARHAVIGKAVAVKVLKREAARDRGVVTRFMQEARAASRIGHPNIVDVTDFGTTPDGLIYSVMEYVEGDTLDRVIASHAPMKPARAVAIAIQIARALGAAHDKGIVHRDLKPDNVFVYDKDGRDFVKIVDFGIAKVTALDGPASPRLTRVGAVFGTPEYMAPEQAAGRGDIDHRVDIYSLGIILYQMIVGRVPHKGDNMMRTLAMQMLDAIEPPRRALHTAGGGLAISDALEQVMLGALAKDRDARFGSMHVLVRALEQAVVHDGQGKAPAPVPGLQPAAPDASASRAGERRAGPRMWLLLAAMVLLGAGGAAAGLLVRGHGDGADAAGRKANERAGDPAGDQAGAGSAAALAAVSPVGAAPARADAAKALMNDAGPDADAPGDAAAGDAAVSDAAVSDAAPSETSRGRRRTAADKRARPRQPIDVQVMTIPSHARLYIGNDYSGQSGTTMRRPEGTTVEVECRLDGYRPGRVKVRFDGKKDMVTCKLIRVKRCVAGIKNPFDDCPE